MNRITWVSLVAQTVKHLPAMRETWVPSLGREYPPDEGMATHSSILAWRISLERSLAGYSPWGHKESDTTERLHFSLSLLKNFIGFVNDHLFMYNQGHLPYFLKVFVLVSASQIFLTSSFFLY